MKKIVSFALAISALCLSGCSVSVVTNHEYTPSDNLMYFRAKTETGHELMITLPLLKETTNIDFLGFLDVNGDTVSLSDANFFHEFGFSDNALSYPVLLVNEVGEEIPKNNHVIRLAGNKKITIAHIKTDHCSELVETAQSYTDGFIEMSACGVNLMYVAYAFEETKSSSLRFRF